MHSGLGYESGISPLAICCTFKNNEAISVLISARGRVTSRAINSRLLQCAAAVNNAEAVQILLTARCSLGPNDMGATPLRCAAGFGAIEAMDELLKHGNTSSRDATYALYTAAFPTGSAEMVHRLVEMMADINARIDEYFKQPFLMRAIYTFKVLQHRFQKVTILSEILFHAKGATPLMISLLSGNDECAAALVAAGTNLNAQNSRGLTAADLIRGRS